MGKASERQVGGDHYRKMKIQPGYFCQVNQLGFMESLAIKYLCRHQDKNGAVDLQKAIHCLQLLLEWQYGDAGRQGEGEGQAPTPGA